MTLGDALIKLGFVTDKSSITGAEKAMEGLKSTATKLLGAIGIGFSIKGIVGLAEAAADAEALSSQFSQVFGDLEDDASETLTRIADETGVSAGRMKSSFSQIASFAKTTGMETSDALELTDRAMVAVADSAAFYDRSLEDVTESLQSFLKGNYENDAALGLSCTDVTRNTAANALYGKSFADLSEAQKQLTLLQMVEDANAASGALGQASRESDTWTNQLGNLKQSIKDLQAAAGSGFLKYAVQVLKLLSTMVQAATEKVKGLTSENGILTKSFESIFAIVKRLQPAIERLWSAFKAGVGTVITKLGGIENIIRLTEIIALTFAGLYVALNAGKILDFFTKLKGMLTAANMKLLAIIGVIILVALLVEDFVNFLQGNDSVIGTVFDKLGIGADNARNTIFTVFGKVKAFLTTLWGTISVILSNAWETIQNTVQTVLGNLSAWWEENGDSIIATVSGMATTVIGWITTIANFIIDHMPQIQETFGAVFNAVKTVVTTVIPLVVNTIKAGISLISTIVSTVLNAVSAIWDRWGTQITSIVDVVFSTVGTIFENGLTIITNIANLISALLTGDFAGAFEALQNIVGAVWDTVISILSAGWEIIGNLFTIGADAIGSVLTNIFDTVSEIAGNIADAIIDGIQAAVDWITALPEQALQWGADFINGLIEGIKGAIGGVTDAVKGIADGITSFLHFSVPDTGPLTDYQSWMPDFMAGLASGITNSSDVVMSAVNAVLANIESGFTAGLPVISDGLRNGLMTALAGLMSISDGAETIGLNFARAIASGITNGAAYIADAVQGIAGMVASVELPVNSLPVINVDGIKAAIAGIQTEISGALSDISAQIALLASNAYTWGSGLVTQYADGIQSAISLVTRTIQEIIDLILALLALLSEQGRINGSSFMSYFIRGIESMASALETSVKKTLNDATDWIKTLPKDAVQWGSDIMTGLASGMSSAMSKVDAAVNAVASKITSYLHFSVPDAGPLAEYESWMPDFMAGLANGISNNEDTVLNAVKTLAEGISALGQNAVASASTAVTNSAVTNNSTVNQYNTFSNSYTGTADNNSEKIRSTMKKSASDTSTYLARALAYGR